MKISFIISYQGKEERLEKTLNSLYSKLKSEFEVIIIANHFCDSLKTISKKNNNIKIIINSKPQETSYNWNLGIKEVSNDYFILLKEGSVVLFDILTEINNSLKMENYRNFDILQFSNNEKNKIIDQNDIYNISSFNNIFAGIDYSVYNKIFSRKIIQEYKILFNENVRYDFLFIYKVLIHSKDFAYIDIDLIEHKKTIIKYSIFDLVRQWPHIFNYVKKENIYQNIKNELFFSYFNFLMNYFLVETKSIGQPFLYKKSLKLVYWKIKSKQNFLPKENNEYLSKIDKESIKVMNDIFSYITNEINNGK